MIWPTLLDIARSWELWQQYWPYDAPLTEAAFKAMTVDEKVALQRELYHYEEEPEE